MVPPHVEIINKYVSIDKVICDPFYMNGSVKEEWKKINRDIPHNDTDFFESYYDCDIFISNPPYSNLLDVFRRFFNWANHSAFLYLSKKYAS